MTCFNRRALVVGCLVLVCPSGADAHAVGAEAKLKDGRVTVEVFFDDDSPGAGAKVKVADAAGKVVAEGVADANGVWAFPAPPPGKYRVGVDAGAGHRATVALTVPAAAPSPEGERPPAESAPGVPAVTVSDGASRAEFTGPMRFVWAAAGVLVVLLATWGLARILRAARRRAGSAGRLP